VSELSEASRALLAAARQGMSPDAAAVKRVHAKVSGGLLAGVAAKLMLVAIVAVGGGAIVAAQHRGSQGDAPVVNVAPAAEVRPIEPRVAHVEAPPPAPAVTTAKPAARHEVDLAREVTLIDQASTAAPAAALTILSVYDAETGGRGQLAEDAAALGIEARCKLGEDVVAVRAAFEARWPSSAHDATIRAACD